MGDKLRDLRRAKGLKQWEVARLCGVSPDTYRRWEWGTQEPRVTHLVTLAAVFDVELEELIHG